MEQVECIHELPFKQCALCSTSDWHVGVQVRSDEKFVENLIKETGNESSRSDAS